MSTLTDEIPSARTVRLDAYEARTAGPLIVASFVFLGLYAMQVLWLSMPRSVARVSNVFEFAIWLAFLVDFIYRVYLAERRVLYVVTHTLDVLTLVLPMFRPLRALRVFVAARMLIERGHHVAYGRVAAAIGSSVVLIVLVGALAVLDFERGVPGSNIETFGEALWWGAVTITTVGYGDYFPVTGGGRVAAVGMMAVGISIIGVVTASFAGWFTERVKGASEDATAQLLVEVRELRAEVARLRDESAGERGEASDRPGDGASIPAHESSG